MKSLVLVLCLSIFCISSVRAEGSGLLTSYGFIQFEKALDEYDANENSVNYLATVEEVNLEDFLSQYSNSIYPFYSNEEIAGSLKECVFRFPADAPMDNTVGVIQDEFVNVVLPELKASSAELWSVETGSTCALALLYPDKALVVQTNPR